MGGRAQPAKPAAEQPAKAQAAAAPPAPKEARKEVAGGAPMGAAAAPARRPRSTEGAAEAKAAARMTTAEWKALQVGMAERWPAPSYMSVPQPGRSHTCYRDETYAAITRWMADTKISYRPHAKAPGSKSHVRYEEYSVATSVGEALSLGTWPADWCWDYERGYIKVEGPLRDEPIDISKVTDESTLTDVDWAIHRWYRRELAKNLGLDIKDLAVGKGGGESIIMRAHRLVAQREARKRLEAAGRERRRITEAEVLQTLREWAFAKNPNRQNVLPDGQEWVWSDTLGLLRDRLGDIHLTAPTKAYPEVAQLLNRYLTDRLPPEAAGFTWTSLNLNCNYAAKLHRDGNNFGPSFIKAFGDFTGGQLSYWAEDDRTDRLERLRPKDKVDLDLKRGLGLFNGNCGHSVADFEGERYTVVYFTVGCFAQAPEGCMDELASLGFTCPAPDAERYALLRAPRGYGGGGRATPNKLPAFRFYASEGLEAAPFTQRRGRSASAGGRRSAPGAKAKAKATPAKEPRKRSAAEARSKADGSREAKRRRARGGA